MSNRIPTKSDNQDRAPAAVDYSEYLELPALLAVQHPRAEPPVHDETLFIIVHQTHELWFKQIVHELRAIIEHIDAERWPLALRGADRIALIVRLLAGHLDVLATMPPEEFQRFRSALGTASGVQSEQYKAMESLSGHAPGDPNAPSVRASFSRAICARQSASGAAAQPLDPSTVTSAFCRVYREPGWEQQRRVAERLLDFDEQMTLWRMRHVELARQMIGSAPGTGGSMGVRYLRDATDRRFFPELAAARTASSKPEEARRSN
jgi:tryptophan 2,3-dioxygenase